MECTGRSGFRRVRPNRGRYKYKLDGGIVWNAHKSVFGSKRSAIYAVLKVV